MQGHVFIKKHAEVSAEEYGFFPLNLNSNINCK